MCAPSLLPPPNSLLPPLSPAYCARRPPLFSRDRSWRFLPVSTQSLLGPQTCVLKNNVRLPGKLPKQGLKAAGSPLVSLPLCSLPRFPRTVYAPAGQRGGGTRPSLPTASAAPPNTPRARLGPAPLGHVTWQLLPSRFWFCTFSRTVPERDALPAALPEASSVWRCAPPPGPRICEVFSPLRSPAPRVAGRGWPLLPLALWARLPPVSAVWGPSCGLTFASPRPFSGTSAVPGLWERILRKSCLLLIMAKTQHEKLLS